MKKKKEELADVLNKLESEKDKKTKHTQILKKQREEKMMQFNSKIKDLK